MKEISIYIETTKGPKRRTGRYLYVIEYICSNGKEALCGSGGELPNTTENELVLTGLLSSIKRLTEPAYLRIYVSNPHFRNSYQNGWVIQWKKNGWKKADGSSVANHELWSQLMKVMSNHLIVIQPDEHNKYTGWMNLELKLDDFSKKYRGEK